MQWFARGLAILPVLGSLAPAQAPDSPRELDWARITRVARAAGIPSDLSADDKRNLIAFLKALTGHQVTR